MKKFNIILSIVFLFPLLLKAQDDVKKVHDKGLQQQIKFTYGWEQYEVTTDSLYPHDWYWLFEHELGNYIDGDYYPNYKVTLETSLETRYTEMDTKKELRFLDTLYTNEIYSSLSYMIDFGYNEDEFLWRLDTFNFYKNKIINLRLPESEHIAENMDNLFKEEQDKVIAIKSSYMESEKKTKAYIEYKEEMDNIIAYIKRLYKLMKLCKNSPFEH